MGEDQANSGLSRPREAGFPGPARPRRQPAPARQGAAGTAAKEPAAIEAATLVLHNAQTLVDGHVGPSPISEKENGDEKTPPEQRTLHGGAIVTRSVAALSKRLTSSLNLAELDVKNLLSLKKESAVSSVTSNLAKSQATPELSSEIGSRGAEKSQDTGHCQIAERSGPAARCKSGGAHRRRAPAARDRRAG